MDTYSSLQKSETAVQRGGFVILFRHDNWYLLGTRESGDKRRITSVHVMSPERAKGILAETPSAVPKGYVELGSNFSDEIEKKVLSSAPDYLPFLRSQAASLSAGLHTDTMQIIEYTESKELAFLEAITEMFAYGKPGICLYFRGDAL